MATSILQRFLDADQWAEEDTMVGRLGMVMHAAFLFAGFQPYGAQPPSGYLLKQESPPVNKKGLATMSLCRWYTARELQAQRFAEAAVLMLSARGSDIALLAFLVMADGNVRKLYWEHLDRATVAPLLSAGAMADTEPRGSRICGELSDAVCWPLLVDLCHRNGVRLRSSMFSPDGVTGLLSMPDDIMVVILGKLTDGEDLARVVCTCQELKELVEGRDADAQLWKPLCEALDARRRRRTLSLWHDYYFPEDEARAALPLRLPEESWNRRTLSLWHDYYFPEDEVRAALPLRPPLRLPEESWKQKYVKTRPRPWDRICRLFLCDYFPAFSGKISWPPLFSWIADLLEPETVATRGEEYMYITGGHRSKREGKYCKKRKGHGAGVIHSPSSRNRWKHR